MPSFAVVSILHRLLRVVQLVASGVAFVSTASSFGVTHSNGISYRLGSPAASLHLLATYTALLYAAWLVVCVELLALATRPRLPMLRLLDSATFVLLVLAGVVFKRSDYVSHCDEYGFMLTCRGFDVAVASTLVAAVGLIACVALTYVACSREESNALAAPPVGYMAETTPSALVASPLTTVNEQPTPSTKV